MSGSSPIYIVSGGMGISGDQLVRTALAQFQEVDVKIVITPQVRQVAQLEEVVEQAVSDGGIIFHTLVDADLHRTLIDLARDHNVAAIDLMGPVLLQLTRFLKQEPLGQPGLYRQLREDHFKRLEAIEFAVGHDDGRKSGELHLAEIVLIGVSRVGKTPISIYLAMEGWKTANIPLIREVPPPQELFEIDPRRVVGLTIETSQLLAYRRHRQRRMGIPEKSAYADASEYQEEEAFAREVFRRGQFSVFDVTNRSIEESASEIITLVTRQLRQDAT